MGYREWCEVLGRTGALMESMNGAPRFING